MFALLALLLLSLCVEACDQVTRVCSLKNAQSEYSSIHAYTAMRHHRVGLVAPEWFVSAVVPHWLGLISQDEYSVNINATEFNVGSFSLLLLDNVDLTQNVDTLLVVEDNSALTSVQPQSTVIYLDTKCKRSVSNFVWYIQASNEHCSTITPDSEFIASVSQTLTDVIVEVAQLPSVLSTGRVAMILLFTPCILLTLFLEVFHLMHRLKQTRTSAKGYESVELAALDSDCIDTDEELGEVESLRDPTDPLTHPEWYYEGKGRTICWSLCIFAAVLFLCAFFDSSSLIHFHLRQYSLDMFLGVFAITLVIAGLRVVQHEKPSDDTAAPISVTILSRDQTEEWKGLMQVGFVLYHYFHTHDAYKLIRVYIDAYVWLTGFGNLMYFVKRRDFSISRLIRMWWRINIFVVFLALSMNNEYMEYYICPMHTFWFFFVFVMMLPLSPRFGVSQANEKLVASFCLIVSFIFVTSVFEVKPIWTALMSPFKFLYLNGDLHEWWFRTNLDHYATWAGMLVAFFLPTWVSLQSKLDNMDSKTNRYFIRAGITTVLVSILLVFSSKFLFSDKYDKFSYNSLNPYISLIPIMCYLILRNLFPYLRNRHLSVCSWMGRITLETYLLQFHIWLGDNAKSVILLVEGFPFVNFVLMTALYITCSYAIFTATNNLISHLLVPPKVSDTEAAKRMMIGFGTIGISYAAAYAIVS